MTRKIVLIIFPLQLNVVLLIAFGFSLKGLLEYVLLLLKESKGLSINLEEKIMPEAPSILNLKLTLSNSNNMKIKVKLPKISMFVGLPEGALQPDGADNPPQHNARAAPCHPQHPQTQPRLLRPGS